MVVCGVWFCRRNMGREDASCKLAVAIPPTFAQGAMHYLFCWSTLRRDGKAITGTWKFQSAHPIKLEGVCAPTNLQFEPVMDAIVMDNSGRRQIVELREKNEATTVYVIPSGGEWTFTVDLGALRGLEGRRFWLVSPRSGIISDDARVP